MTLTSWTHKTARFKAIGQLVFEKKTDFLPHMGMAAMMAM